MGSVDDRIFDRFEGIEGIEGIEGVPAVSFINRLLIDFEASTRFRFDADAGFNAVAVWVEDAGMLEYEYLIFLKEGSLRFLQRGHQYTNSLPSQSVRASLMWFVPRWCGVNWL